MADRQKTAIITGASQGIGAALVEAFLKRGYGVVANSRNISKANPFPASANLALVDGDIGDPKTAARIVDASVSRFGRIDVLSGYFYSQALHGVHDRRFRRLGLDDAGWVSLRFIVIGKVNAANRRVAASSMCQRHWWVTRWPVHRRPFKSWRRAVWTR